MAIPTRIQRLLDDRALETIQAPDADAAALWEKAVRSAQDSQNSLDNQYVLGYQALFQMGTAIIAAAGYRTRGPQGHHANTFYAVAALAIAGLEELDIRAERIRQMRKLSAYLPGSPTAEQIDKLRELLDSTLPAARQWLTAARPQANFTPLP
jgi:hypothetical protein